MEIQGTKKGIIYGKQNNREKQQICRTKQGNKYMENKQKTDQKIVYGKPKQQRKK